MKNFDSRAFLYFQVASRIESRTQKILFQFYSAIKVSQQWLENKIAMNLWLREMHQEDENYAAEGGSVKTF